MKDELNRSYNGGGVVYLLQSELSNSTLHYPLVGVNVMVILHVFIIKITLRCYQIINLNTHFESFTPFMHSQEFI